MLKNIRVIPDIAAATSAGLVRSPTTTWAPISRRAFGPGILAVHHGPHRLVAGDELFDDEPADAPDAAAGARHKIRGC